MKNKEKYAKELLDIGKYEKIALSGGKPVKCNITKCDRCERYKLLEVSGIEMCSDLKFLEWADAEYEEPTVDWSKVQPDAKILVSDDLKHWYRRHFKKYEDGKVYAFFDGCTSWSSGDIDRTDDRYKEWEYAKLAEE